MTTNPGDLVADPFLGGGSTAVACLKTGRRFYGGDLNPHALRLAVARILAEVAPAMHADAAQLALLDAVSGGWA
jgi:DNA modification methylase